MKHTNTHEDTYQKTQHKGIDTSTTICRKRKNEDGFCWFRRKSVFYCVIYFVFASKNTFLYSCVSLYMFVFLCVTVLLSMFPPNFFISRNLQFFIIFLYCVYSVPFNIQTYKLWHLIRENENLFLNCKKHILYIHISISVYDVYYIYYIYII